MGDDLPKRQDLRLKGWNYATPGHYFVTVCARERREVFGAVVNGRAVLNACGQVADACWREIPKHFPSARVDEYVVMPNHMHGVIELLKGSAIADPCNQAIADPCTLGDVIGAYKSAVSRILGRQFPTRTLLPVPAGGSALWHRNYWDVVVRSDKALAAIRAYIRSNPQNYHAVMNCGEPEYLGDKTLLDRPKLGFLASRGEAVPHSTLPIRSGEAILSGFLSPMERRVFQAGLAHKRPLIWVKPWGLSEGNESPAIREALEQGRLLILSPFDNALTAPSARRAIWCNEYVLAHCDRLAVGHLNPEGMLACILSEAAPDLEIVYL